MNRSMLCAALVVAAALLACKKDDQGVAGSACMGDQDCKNGFLCESAVCIPKDSAEKIRAASQPAPGAAAPATAPENRPSDEAESAGKTAPENSKVPAIPEGRSSPPTIGEWGAAEEVNTQEHNSQPDKCELKVVREWVRVTCRGNIVGTEKMENFGTKNSDYFELITTGKLASFVVRMKPGRTQSVRICRDQDRASLFVNWPAGKDRPVHIALGKGPVCGT